MLLINMRKRITVVRSFYSYAVFLIYDKVTDSLLRSTQLFRRMIE